MILFDIYLIFAINFTNLNIMLYVDTYNKYFLFGICLLCADQRFNMQGSINCMNFGMFKSPIDRHLVVSSLLLLGCCTEYTHE